MSTRRTDTSSKRKRTPPQKLKNRKLFAASRNDIKEQSPHMSKDEDDQESQQCFSGHHETLQNKENVPKSQQHKKNLPEAQSKKENMTEIPQNKENMPGKYTTVAGTAHRGRGRPKGSKNKTFPTNPTRVYSVREGKSLVYAPKIGSYGDSKLQDGSDTPHRGRGRPKGSTKVKRNVDAPKRSRGRPKGSKNRKPSKASLVKRLPGTPKMARGRPRKVPTTDEGVPMEGAVPKRSRGRPKGSPNKIPSARKLALLAGIHEERKRGSPKKIIFDDVVIMPLSAKRPRGRPKSTGSFIPVSRIQLQSSVPDTQDEEDYDDDDDEDDVDDE